MSDIITPKRDFGFYFWAHLLLILAAWFSWALVPWLGIAIALPFYYAQFLFLGECVVTKAEFGTFKPQYGFYGHYCRYLGLGNYARQVDQASHRFLPIGLAFAGFLFQHAAGNKPLFEIDFLTLSYVLSRFS